MDGCYETFLFKIIFLIGKQCQKAKNLVSIDQLSGRINKDYSVSIPIMGNTKISFHIHHFFLKRVGSLGSATGINYTVPIMNRNYLCTKCGQNCWRSYRGCTIGCIQHNPFSFQNIIGKETAKVVFIIVLNCNGFHVNGIRLNLSV